MPSVLQRTLGLLAIAATATTIGTTASAATITIVVDSSNGNVDIYESGSIAGEPYCPHLWIHPTDFSGTLQQRGGVQECRA
jgi:hypothetical protein